MSDDLLLLAERVDSGSGADNALDVLVEIALFEPDKLYVSIRANAARTKLICTTSQGSEATFRAEDWTMDRAYTSALLRARHHLQKGRP